MSAPRFYVRESSGYPIGRRGSLITHISVYDRAYCHCEVRRFGAGSRETWTNYPTLALARVAADKACVRLNAGVGRDGPWPKAVPRP